jgi:hypothetical protein
VEERAKVGLVISLPLSGEFAHLSHGFIPTLHALHRLALFFSDFFASHCYNIPHKRPLVNDFLDKSYPQAVSKFFVVSCGRAGCSSHAKLLAWGL